jgi:hypothetical protein
MINDILRQNLCETPGSRHKIHVTCSLALFPLFFRAMAPIRTRKGGGGHSHVLQTNIVTSVTFYGCRVTSYQVSQRHVMEGPIFGYMVAHGYMELVGYGRCMVTLSRVTPERLCRFKA